MSGGVLKIETMFRWGGKYYSSPSKNAEIAALFRGFSTMPGAKLSPRINDGAFFNTPIDVAMDYGKSGKGFGKSLIKGTVLHYIIYK